MGFSSSLASWRSHLLLDLRKKRTILTTTTEKSILALSWVACISSGRESRASRARGRFCMYSVPYRPITSALRKTQISAHAHSPSLVHTRGLFPVPSLSGSRHCCKGSLRQRPALTPEGPRNLGSRTSATMPLACRRQLAAVYAFQTFHHKIPQPIMTNTTNQNLTEL